MYHPVQFTKDEIFWLPFSHKKKGIAADVEKKLIKSTSSQHINLTVIQICHIVSQAARILKYGFTLTNAITAVDIAMIFQF